MLIFNGERGDTVVGNGVVVLGGRALNKGAKTEALKRIGQ